jgi:hypothetical protein
VSRKSKSPGTFTSPGIEHHLADGVKLSPFPFDAPLFPGVLAAVRARWLQVMREVPALSTVNEHGAFLALLHDRDVPLAFNVAHPADTWTLSALDSIVVIASYPRPALAQEGRGA